LTEKIAVSVEQVLRELGVAVPGEIRLLSGSDGDRAAQAAMASKANGRWTVPQIFIGDTHVGGCDDLHALEDAGELDALLAG